MKKQNVITFYDYTKLLIKDYIVVNYDKTTVIKGNLEYILKNDMNIVDYIVKKGLEYEVNKKNLEDNILLKFMIKNNMIDLKNYENYLNSVIIFQKLNMTTKNFKEYSLYFQENYKINITKNEINELKYLGLNNIYDKHYRNIKFYNYINSLENTYNNDIIFENILGHLKKINYKNFKQNNFTYFISIIDKVNEKNKLIINEKIKKVNKDLLEKIVYRLFYYGDYIECRKEYAEKIKNLIISYKFYNVDNDVYSDLLEKLKNGIEQPLSNNSFNIKLIKTAINFESKKYKQKF